MMPAVPMPVRGTCDHDRKTLTRGSSPGQALTLCQRERKKEGADRRGNLLLAPGSVVRHGSPTDSRSGSPGTGLAGPLAGSGRVLYRERGDPTGEGPRLRCSLGHKFAQPGPQGMNGVVGGRGRPQGPPLRRDEDCREEAGLKSAPTQEGTGKRRRLRARRPLTDFGRRRPNLPLPQERVKIG